MRRLLAFLGFCGFLVAVSASPAASQEIPPDSLFGQVMSSGGPLAGATVKAFLAGSSTPTSSATTAQDGKYRVTGLAQGVYRIEFSRDGFESVTRFGIVVLDGAPQELNVMLTPPASGSATSATAGEPIWSQLSSIGDYSLRPGEVGVRIETNLGFIFLAIDTAHAPVTAANFLKYVDGGFYDGGRFHRATRADDYTAAPPNRPMMEIIQGGINPDRKSAAFQPIPLERTSVTGLKHVRGTVSMARGTGADTATSDFFILLDDQPSLDFGGKRFDDGQGGAAFGRVISGMDVVKKIQQQPVEGQNLTPPVAIVAVRRM
jgi:peptidyl-prolyl cis-trans isomerase A (cyclophilin A)